MAVNIYDQPFQAQYINTYVPMPYQEILQAGSAMQGRYDTAEAIRDDLTSKMLDIKALEADKQLKDQLLGEYETSINKKLDEVGNDYGQLLPFIKQQQRKFQDDYQRGQLGQIQANYTKFMTEYEEAKDRMIKGDVSKEEFNATFGPGGEALAQYTGVGDRGDLQEIQIRDLVDQNNYQEIAIDIASKLEGQKAEVLGQWLRGQGLSERDLPPNYLQALDRSTDILKYEDIYDIVSFAIQKNPMYQSHIQQRQDLLSGQMERDLAGIDKDFVDYYLQDGVMPSDDIEAMEAQGLDSNDRDDQVEYFKDKYRQGILDNLVGDNARLAGTMFQKADVSYDRNIRKDDLLTERMKKQQNILDSTYISTTPGEIQIQNTEDFRNKIKDNTQNTKDQMTSAAELVSKIMTNTVGPIPEGTTSEDILRSYVTEMKNKSKRQDLIDAGNTPENLDYAYVQAESALLSNARLEQQRALLNAAKEKVINNIDWEKEWENEKEFISNMKVTGDLHFWGSGVFSGETLTEVYNQLGIKSAENLKDFVGKFGTKEELINTLESVKGYDFNTNNYADSAIDRIKRELGGIWGDLNEKTDTELKTGIARNYTKIDFAAGDKKSAEMGEITDATNALADPTTRIIVPGIGETTLTEFFANNPDVGEYGGEVEASLIMDKGKPYYSVTAWDNQSGKEKKSISFLAEIPGREAPILEFMNTNTQNKNKNVAKMAKAYIGAYYMGDFWHPNKLVALSPNSEVSVPLSLKDGTKIGQITKEERGYKVVYVGDNRPRYYSKPIDIAMGVYDAINLAQKN